jgi:hypothetical protein
MATFAMDPDRFVAAPHDLMEAPGARACARYAWSPCLGRRNCAHRKIERRRNTGLGWPLLNGSTQQPTERWYWRLEGRWRGDLHGWNAWGGTFSHRFGWRMERQKKNINRDGDGALDFDGFCWIGGHNNQPKMTALLRYIWSSRRAR